MARWIVNVTRAASESRYLNVVPFFAVAPARPRRSTAKTLRVSDAERILGGGFAVVKVRSAPTVVPLALSATVWPDKLCG